MEIFILLVLVGLPLLGLLIIGARKGRARTEMYRAHAEALEEDARRGREAHARWYMAPEQADMRRRIYEMQKRNELRTALQGAPGESAAKSLLERLK